ncbi:hypothetical protein NGH54_12865 [Staphylococcus xylosus]|uniref:hypothetical protein n=1 Tax=Staphylococcus xylosus TaxID=1288 RepID=UPI002DBCBFCE|nr:hypothetical protein [Staphylococcus xylosus]MEB8071609.1 hypothetical protein [Staphylococcus xylosus]
MGIAEQILDELKLLNKNLRVTNTELSTVDESVVQNIVKETPMKKVEEPKPQSEPTTDEQNHSKDDVMGLGKQFVQKADDSDKKAFKEKLEELGANKLSNVSEEHFSEIVDFMNARLNA